MSVHRSTTRRRRGEGGQVGGVEAVWFGVLVFVLGGLGIAAAWSVVDQKVAVSSAAREVARTFVESGGSEDDLRRAEAAGRAAFAGHGRDPTRLSISIQTPAFNRCASVTVIVSAPISLPRIPVIGGPPGRPTVAARHREIVDPYRSGLARRGGNPCK